jgi:subtilisin family serine protease
MKTIVRNYLMLMVLCCCCNMASAQMMPANVPNLDKWQLLDWKKDGMAGISLQQAYDFLQQKKYKTNPVIVGIIDTGIDTTHVDLKNVLWKNSGEIPGNGIDDDKNGYIDDVYGWNFLGGKDGQTLDKEVSVTERAYQLYKKKWENFDSTKVALLKPAEAFEYKMWKRVLTNKKQDAAADAKGPGGVARTSFMGQMMNTSPEAFYYRNLVQKDNYYDFSDRYYGNGDVMGKDLIGHGTHVSGIVAADRTNGIGVNGVADHARIMFVKSILYGASPWDKDLALAIRYAVDNGARVINLSAGYNISTDIKWLDDALRYAADHDVLFVQAAGNSSIDRDLEENSNFPNPVALDGTMVNNYINVGASNRLFEVSPLSCYGKKSVNVFAPGQRIYSTTWRKNKYTFYDGTSMAAPVVAGLAALIREYFPDLSARQVKYVIEHSVIKPEGPVGTPDPKGKPVAMDGVLMPETGKKVLMSELCTSGGIVNAYEAVKLASTLKGELKKDAVKKILKIQNR